MRDLQRFIKTYFTSTQKLRRLVQQIAREVNSRIRIAA